MSPKFGARSGGHAAETEAGQQKRWWEGRGNELFVLPTVRPRRGRQRSADADRAQARLRVGQASAAARQVHRFEVEQTGRRGTAGSRLRLGTVPGGRASSLFAGPTLPKYHGW